MKTWPSRRILPEEAPRFREGAVELLRRCGWPEGPLDWLRQYEGELPEGLSSDEVAQIEAIMLKVEKLCAKAIRG
jgi:hypothetical protein